jgi:hypothetical protein
MQKATATTLLLHYYSGTGRGEQEAIEKRKRPGSTGICNLFFLTLDRLTKNLKWRQRKKI